MRECDIAIVGAGLAGSLAAVISRSGTAAQIRDRVAAAAADGTTELLTGTYLLDGEVSGRLLRALPGLLVEHGLGPALLLRLLLL